MAELTERDLNDRRRGLEALIARDLKAQELQRKQMAIWKDDDRPSAVSRYNAAKAELTRLDTNIKTLQAELETIGTQITSIGSKKKETDVQKKIVAKQKELKFAIESLDTKKQETLNNEIKALQSSVGQETVGDTQYEGDNEFVKDVNAKGLALTTDPSTGESWVSGSEGGNQVQQYIYIGEEGRPVETVGGKLRKGSASTPYTPATSDFDALRKRVIDDAVKSSRGLKGLFDDLRSAGLRIPQVDYDRLDTTSPSFGKALSYALQKHTKAIVNDLEVNKNIQPKSFNRYLQEDLKNAGLDKPEVSYNEYVTKVDEAESDLNRFFMDYVGRSATDEEQKRYYKQLRALEKKNAQVTTTKETDSGGTSQITTGEYRLDAEDMLQLQRKIAGKALDGSDIDVILKGGSKAAQDVNNVLAYAKSYGVTLSNKDALRYVSTGLKNNERDTKAIQAKLLAVSKATYSNLSDVLSESVDLDDLSANYKYTMRQILEIPESQIDTLNPTIQMALKNNGNKGAMNLTDFERALKKDPRWANTSNALETAAGYANNILRNFGLIA